MNPQNAERVEELLEARRKIKQMYDELIDWAPGEIGYLTHDGWRDPIIFSTSPLTIDSLGKIRCHILGEMEKELEEIDKELEVL